MGEKKEKKDKEKKDKEKKEKKKEKATVRSAPDGSDNHWWSWPLQGATTIRAFNQQQRFFTENEARVTSHLHCNYIRWRKQIQVVAEIMNGLKNVQHYNFLSDMANRWLSIRVEFLGNFIVFFAAVFAFYLRQLNPHWNIHKSSHLFSGTPSALAWLPSRSRMPCRWLMALDGQSGRYVWIWDNRLVNGRL